MTCQALERAAAKAALERINPEELPRIAAKALEDGCDSPSLRVLAGSSGVDTWSLFAKALTELSLQSPSPREAVMALARESAEKALAGEITSYECANEIYRFWNRVSPEEQSSDLDTFVYAASEWDARPEDANIFAEGVLAAARDLLHN